MKCGASISPKSHFEGVEATNDRLEFGMLYVLIVYGVVYRIEAVGGRSTAGWRGLAYSIYSMMLFMPQFE